MHIFFALVGLVLYERVFNIETCERLPKDTGYLLIGTHPFDELQGSKNTNDSYWHVSVLHQGTKT